MRRLGAARPSASRNGHWAEPDPRAAVLAFLAPYRSRVISVNVDAIGIGYNLGLHLRDSGYPANNVNVGEAAPFNPERFQNMKAELYWALRERFERGEIAGLTDETTLSQLATIRYQYTPQGKVRIESNDDARKRGVKSPDRAEALMLCFGRIRPGILDWAKMEAAREREVRRAADSADLSRRQADIGAGGAQESAGGDLQPHARGNQEGAGGGLMRARPRAGKPMYRRVVSTYE